MRLSAQAEKEVEIFDGEVILSSGVSFNYRETLKKINKHKRGKFHNCSDADAIFWALGMQRAPHFAKKLDVDTRHFRIEGYGDYNCYQAWACNIRFRKWARETGFALDLDNFGDALADFGSTIIKLKEKKGGGYDCEECDLMKIWFDPTIKFLYEQTKLELHELEEYIVADKNGWENKDEAWEQAEVVDYSETEKSDVIEQVAQKRKFWERIGYFDVSFYEKEDLINGRYLQDIKKVSAGGQETTIIEDLRKKKKNKWKYMRTIHCGSGEGEVIVYAEEIKPEDDLYIDLHISKYEDRWLRIGVYERLFDLQKMSNEVVNYDRDAQKIATLLLFRSKTKKIVGSNILQEAETGLVTDADLEQIGITNTALRDFTAKVGIYEQKADQLCMTPDVITGEESGQKTFRGLAAMTNMANSAFKKSRDRICFSVSKLLVERILPAEIKNWNKEDSLEIAGFDVDVRMFDTVAVKIKLNEWIEKKFEQGINPNEEEKTEYIERLKQSFETEGRKLKLPKNFYDFDFGLGINASGESENREQQNDAYYNVIQWVSVNPVVATIPAFREYCEKNNIIPFHLSAEQIKQIQQGQAGGQPAEPIQVGGKKDALSAQIDTQE